MIRNRHLRAEAEMAKGIVRSPVECGIAALLLDDEPDKRIADAVGMTYLQLVKRMCVLRKRAGARSRVGLALALRELV